MFGIKLPDLGLGDIEKIRDMIGEYVKFSHDAQLTIIKNQHAIHARLAAIEAKLSLPVAPLLLLGPEPPLMKLNGAAPPETNNEGTHNGAA